MKLEFKTVWSSVVITVVASVFGAEIRTPCKSGTKVVSKNPPKKEITSCTEMGSGVTIRNVETVQSGNTNGTLKGFWPNGKLESQYSVKKEEQVDSFFRWDSSGNLTARGFYRNGKPSGKQEAWFGVDRPKDVRYYDSNGFEDGPTFQWWPNGNKKLEGVKKQSNLTTATEFYPNGRPRVKYQIKHEPNRKLIFKSKYISAESWAPNGKSCGKIQNGNGEWILFPSGADSTDRTTFREVYRDSLAIKIEKVDSATVSRWCEP